MRPRRSNTGLSGPIPRTFAALVALALAISSCGNSTSKGGARTETTASESTDRSTTAAGGSDENVPNASPGVSDTEIRVGGVASITNPLGGKYADAFEGVKAYFDMVNAEGGVFGRQLVVAAERDDKLANNKSEVEGLLSQDNVFAALPMASLLFTGADTLVEQGVPTFGWTVNPEWEGTKAAPRSNLFGQTGSFLCFGCDGTTVPWIAQEIEATKIGVLAYSVSQSAQCADGVRASFTKYGKVVGAEVAFFDASLTYGTADLSVQVEKMKAAGVDLVTTCMDTNGIVTLAKEMKKQQLDAVQYVPNGYDHDFLDEFGDLFEGSYVRTDFVQWEVKDRPKGLADFLTWMDKRGVEPSENSVSAWINAATFVAGLRAAGPTFTRQKVIDAVNVMSDFDADGLIHGVDWTIGHTTRESETENCQFLSKIEAGEFVPAFSEPGKPFVCGVFEGGKITTRNDA